MAILYLFYLLDFIQILYYHQFIPPVINDLHRNAPVLTCLERFTQCPCKVLPHAVIVCGFKGALQVVPC
ncbi:hypothetical protein ig2599ANME_2445 [groundwater metagenome]